MLETRVIPCLLVSKKGLVKTTRFKDARYLGDPINAIRIFNEKEVDELIVLDIDASKEGRGPNLEFIGKIASECFMPVCYGGGITSIDQIREIFFLGIEKVSLKTAAINNPELVKQAADVFGSQSIVVSIDIKTNLFGKKVVHTIGRKSAQLMDPVDFAMRMESLGAGELLVNSVDKDGMMSGYDLESIRRITDKVNIPVIACGGAGKLSDFKVAVEDGGASGVAAGSLFVFQGVHKAVLINYPSQEALIQLWKG